LPGDVDLFAWQAFDLAQNPCHVTTGTGIARDQAQLYWIVQYGGHNRDGCSCLSGSNGRRRIEGWDQVRLQLHKLRGKRRPAGGISVGVPCGDFDVLSLDVAELAQAVQKGRNVWRESILRSGY